MLVCDRDLLVYNHRVSIFKLEITGTEIKCKQCKKQLNTSGLHIEEVKDKFLEIDPCIPNTNAFEWQDNKKRFKVLFRFPTVQIQDYFDSLLETLGHISTKDWISHLIIRINDSSSTSDILETLKYETSIYKQLKRYVTTMMPQKYFTTNKLICSFCQTDNTIRSKIDIDFFPFRIPNFKEVYIDEYIYLMKELRISMDQLLKMPVENRKYLIERFQKLSKPNDPNNVVPQKQVPKSRTEEK